MKPTKTIWTLWILIVALGFSSHTFAEEKPIDVSVETPRALTFSLSNAGVTSVTSEIKASLLDKVISGRIDDEYNFKFMGMNITISEIDYSFTIDSLDLTQKTDLVTLDLKVREVTANIGRLTFNSSGTRYCTNIPITSKSNKIPVTAGVEAEVVERLIELTAKETDIALSSSNFKIGYPEQCKVLVGFNLIVKLLTPAIANMFRGVIEKNLEETVGDIVADTSELINRYATMQIKLPMEIQLLPPFYASIGMRPWSISITEDRFAIVFSAFIDIDPDKSFDIFTPPHINDDTSFIGLSDEFIRSIFVEGNDKEIFNYTYNSPLVPYLAPILTREKIERFLPDAETRFGDDAEIGIKISGFRDVDVILSAKTESEIHLVAEDINMTLMVNNAPYYEIVTSMIFPISIVVDSDKNLALELEELTYLAAKGDFAPSLTPEPTDKRFIEAFFVSYMTDFFEIIAEEGSRAIVELPEFSFGTTRLRFNQVIVRDGFIALDTSFY